MLKSLLLDSVKHLPATFEMFVTLKIISRDNAMALSVFEKVNFKDISPSSVREFDLYRFITKNSRENTECFCTIVQNEIHSPELLGILVEKTLKSVERLRAYDLPEE